MNKRILAAAGVVAVAAGALGVGVSTAFASNEGHSVLRIGQARLVDPAGGSLGTVQLIELNGKLNVIGRVRGLTVGFHGFHIHEKGECIGSSTPPFTSAGGHLKAAGPAGGSHAGHAGDMPVLLVGADGTAQTSFTTDRVRLANILDADGAAIMIHALPDNYANIPLRYAAAGVAGPDATTLTTGDAGGRVACGVVTGR